MTTYFIVTEDGQVLSTDSKHYAERMSDEQLAVCIDPSKERVCIEGSWINISAFDPEEWLEDEEEEGEG